MMKLNEENIIVLDELVLTQWYLLPAVIYERRDQSTNL